MQIMLEICENFNEAKDRMSFEDISRKINIPIILLSDLLLKLENGGYLIHTCNTPQQYYPKVPPEKIIVSDFLDFIRNETEAGSVELQKFHHNRVITGLFEHITNTVHESLAGQTFKDLINNKYPGK